MNKDEIVRYIEAYAASFDPPIHEGVTVSALRRGPSGIFEIDTSAGNLTADQVVVATGGYHLPKIPQARRAVARGHRPDALPRVQERRGAAAGRCARGGVGAAQAVRSPKTFTSRGGASISAWAARRGPRGDTAARTSSRCSAI